MIDIMDVGMPWLSIYVSRVYSTFFTVLGVICCHLLYIVYILFSFVNIPPHFVTLNVFTLFTIILPLHNWSLNYLKTRRGGKW